MTSEGTFRHSEARRYESGFHTKMCLSTELTLLLLHGALVCFFKSRLPPSRRFSGQHLLLISGMHLWRDPAVLLSEAKVLPVESFL